ncbi:hypothetical protein HDU80_004011 [Chytriomyces hyalinus]|nr:hypothetical protein HDU80_004011 [Chytriomyces hyalinus]
MDLMGTIPVSHSDLLDYRIPTFFCYSCNKACLIGRHAPCCSTKVCQGCYVSKYRNGRVTTETTESSASLDARHSDIIPADSSIKIEEITAENPRESTCVADATARSSAATRVVCSSVGTCPVCEQALFLPKYGPEGSSWWNLSRPASTVGTRKQKGHAAEGAASDAGLSAKSTDDALRASISTLGEEKKSWLFGFGAKGRKHDASVAAAASGGTREDMDKQKDIDTVLSLVQDVV